jgi:hypothetical protein
MFAPTLMTGLMRKNVCTSLYFFGTDTKGAGELTYIEMRLVIKPWIINVGTNIDIRLVIKPLINS